MLAIANAIAVGAVLWLASQPIDYLYRHVVVDDAIYYVKPALNLEGGRGYSLDGVHRTNGVQPLWALLVAALAAVAPEPEFLVRAMVALGGLLWLGAGLLLCRLLQRLHPLGALLAGLLWVLAGLEHRFALWGMEAGLHAFLLALATVLARGVARTTADDVALRARLWRLGVVTALLALARIEYGLLAVLLGLWVAGADRRAVLRRSLPFLLPLLLLGGGWLLTSRVYFGEWTPISGSVKAWNSERNPAPGHLGDHLLANVLQVTTRTFGAVVWMLVDTLVRWLHRVPGVGEVVGALALLLLPLGCGARGLWQRLRRPEPRRTGAVALLLAGFFGVHLLLLAWILAPYVAYCGWYFAGEVFATCLLLGGLAAALRGWWRLAMAPLGLVALTAFALRAPDWFTRTQTQVTAPYVDAGRFVERWLPAGATIGAFAAGYISLEARSHRVINLDGLINDGRYLREYLMRERLPDYFRDERIGYVADNMPVAQWRRFYRRETPELPAPLQPLHCWPSTADWAVCVLATATGDPALAAARPHPLGPLQFQAIVLREHLLVADAARAALPAGATIAATMLLPLDDTVIHVAVDRGHLGAAVAGEGLAGLPAIEAEFGGRVRLCAVELPPSPVVAGRRALLTSYWRALPAIAAGAPFSLSVRVGSGAQAVGVTDAPALGTLPLDQWPPGMLLAHAFVVAVPAAMPAGVHPVTVAVVGPGGAPLAGPPAEGAPAGGALAVGELRVEAR